MRITQNMLANNTVYNLQQSASQLSKLGDLTASGQNVNTPSDDPIAARLLVQIGQELKLSDQYSSNIRKATTWLNYTSTALTGMSDIINQASKVTGSIINGSTDPNIRQSAHDQLVDLKKQVIDMANTRYGDQYVFAGANNVTQPFSNSNNDYGGDSTQLGIEISQNSNIALNVTGDRLLLGRGEGPSYGSVNILATFDNLIASVGDKSNASNTMGISQGITDLQSGVKQLNNATSDILSRTTRLSNMSNLNDNTKNTLNSIVGKVQNVDYNKLGVELSQQQTAYNAALASTAKVQGMSLLNYISMA